MGMDENQLAMWKAGMASQERYDYFVMALAVAAIGFAVQRTSDLDPSWTMLWVLAAVLAWGVSLFAGFRRQEKVDVALHLHYQILTSSSSTPKDLLEMAEKESQEADDAGACCRKVQTYGFYVGAILFVVWHILETLARANSVIIL